MARDDDQDARRIRERRWSVPHPASVTAVHGEAPTPALGRGPLEVLVWNVYKGKRRSWAPQFRRLVTTRDLVLAQELYFEAQTRAILDASEHQWATATSFTYARRGGVGTGLGTAARAASAGVEALLSAGREPITRTPKLALLTRYQLPAPSPQLPEPARAAPAPGPAQPVPFDQLEELLVVNVHAINFAGYANFVEQIERIEHALADHGGPMLVAGDFNTWTSRRRRRLDDMMRNAALDPVEFPADPRRTPLDHAFTRGLEVRQPEVQPTRASDHAALSFQIERKPE